MPAKKWSRIYGRLQEDFPPDRPVTVVNPDWLTSIARLELPEDLKNLLTEDLRDMVSYGFSDEAIEDFLHDLKSIF